MKPIRATLAGLLIAASAVVFSTGAQAQVIVNGDTTGDPTWNRAVGAGPALSGIGTAVNYETVQIRITDAVAFAAEITSAVFDTYLHLYQGDFNPLDQLTNLVAGDDDGGAGLLSRIDAATDGPFAEGEYTLVVSAFANGQFGTYVLEMLGVVLGWGPTTVEQLDELKAVMAQTGRNTLQIMAGNVKAAAAASLATRGTVLSTKGMAPGMAGNFRAWAEASTAFATSTGRTYRSPLFQVGGDFGITPNLVGGVALAFGDITARSTDITFDGSQFLVEPYVGWNNGAWRGTASIVVGWIDYDTITSISGAASAEGEMLAFAADVGYDFVLDSTTVLTPYVGLQHGQIELTATSGTLAGVGLGDSVSFTEAAVGATMTKTFRTGTFTVGLSAEHFDTDAPTALSSGTFDQTGWSGVARIGLSLDLTDAISLDTDVAMGGLFTNNRSYTGGLRLSMEF